MSYIDSTLIIGAGCSAVRIRLTAAALQLLERFYTGDDEGQLASHRALLTTITVGKAADGSFNGSEMVIDDTDILQVLEHAGTVRAGSSA